MKMNKCISKKIISFYLLVSLVFQNLAVPSFVVLAQEAEQTETQQQEVQAAPTETPAGTVEPTPTAEPVVEPLQTPEPTVAPTPTPTPTMSPDEYDAWKEEKRRLDDERSARDDEWEEHEEDDAWVAAHGGDHEYFVSGNWQRDEDAKKKEEEAQALIDQQNQVSPTPDPLVQTPTVTEQDPFAAQESDPFSDQGQVICSQRPQEEALSLEADASFSSESQNSDSADVSNTNCAEVNNNSYAGGTSGQNTQSQNDGDVSMSTGSAGAQGQLKNSGNTNVTDSDTLGQSSSSSGESFAEGDTAENVNTGEDSENFSETSTENNLLVENNNQAYVDNKMEVEATSGVNEVTENDGGVTLTTGDIELIANMLNILNLNITGDDFLHLIVNIFGTLNGTIDLDDIATALGYADEDEIEILAKNDQTGEDSQNEAVSQNHENTDVSNNNTAIVNNELSVTGVSGGNNVSGNDGDVDIVTGRIEILANIMNFINTNFSGEKWKFIMINIFGSLQGDIVLPGTEEYLLENGSAVSSENSNPGEDSSNSQEASSTDQLNITNSNNVELTNSVNAQAVSGNNEQIGNDDEGHTALSGKTDVVSQLMNFLNFNISGDNWVFLIVNVFGKWMGQIVGFAGNDPLNSPENGTFAALSVGGGAGSSAVNSSTGEGSDNSSISQNTNNTDVNNQNYAQVNNEINVLGVSGENSVNGNDGATNISTGWVEIDANLLNIINMNVTGRNWMFVILNVFGDFMGNMFFGKSAQQQFMAANQPIGGIESQGASNSQGSVQPNEVQTSQNSNNSSSSSASETSTTGNAQAVVETQTDQEQSSVLSFSEGVDTSSQEEEQSSYQAEYNDSDNENEQQQDEDKGFFTRVLLFIARLFTKFFDQVIYLARNIIDNFTVLAQN